jgi:hypothetical protein
MAVIETLIADIYRTLEDGKEVSPEVTQAFGETLAKLIEDRLSGESQEFRIRPSNLGETCLRRLWYQANRPEKAQPLKGQDLLKFLLGDIFEHTVLYLAEAAGHTVTGQQDKMELHGVVGSRDSVIDGVTVDAKSASPYSFQKFANGLTKDQDAFGYLTQLEFYRRAGENDPLVTDKSRAAFLAGEKVLGKLALDFHPASDLDIDGRIKEIQETVLLKDPPPRGFKAEPEGKSGNMALPMKCNYCEFRKTCWPGARTFLYSTGPKHLSVVQREPNVTEIFE